MSEKMRSEERKEQIARAALAIAAEQGISGVTVKGVAEHVGLAPSALYRHYPNREAIIAAVVEISKERLAGVLQEAVQAEAPLEGLRFILASVTAFLKSNRALPLFMSSEETWRDAGQQRDDIRRFFTHYIGVLMQLLRRGQEAGQVRADIDLAHAAILFLGLYMPPALIASRAPDVFRDAMDFERLIEHNWRCFLRAIAPA